MALDFSTYRGWPRPLPRARRRSHRSGAGRRRGGMRPGQESPRYVRQRI